MGIQQRPIILESSYFQHPKISCLALILLCEGKMELERHLLVTLYILPSVGHNDTR